MRLVQQQPIRMNSKEDTRGPKTIPTKCLSTNAYAMYLRRRLGYWVVDVDDGSTGAAAQLYVCNTVKDDLPTTGEWKEKKSTNKKDLIKSGFGVQVANGRQKTSYSSKRSGDSEVGAREAGCNSGGGDSKVGAREGSCSSGDGDREAGGRSGGRQWRPRQLQ